MNPEGLVKAFRHEVAFLIKEHGRRNATRFFLWAALRVQEGHRSVVSRVLVLSHCYLLASEPGLEYLRALAGEDLCISP